MAKKGGVTLIELLIALLISTVLIAALYRTFIGQQKIYHVQGQVSEMQQNARVGINRMMREIRMAGFGNVSAALPLTATDGPFNHVINPADDENKVNRNDDQITIVGAYEQVSTLAIKPEVGTNAIELSGNLSQFNPVGNRKYVSVGGLETHVVKKIEGKTMTLSGSLTQRHDAGDPVYKVKAITYALRWDNKKPNMPVLTREDNTDGGGSQVVAESIENLQFRYTLSDRTEVDSPADPSKIWTVRVAITARTEITDPDLKEGDGFRRRQIASNIQVRNIGVSP